MVMMCMDYKILCDIRQALHCNNGASFPLTISASIYVAFHITLCMAPTDYEKRFTVYILMLGPIHVGLSCTQFSISNEGQTTHFLSVAN